MPSNDLSKYAPANWASNEFEFTTPSGALVLLRNMDPLSLAEEGLLDKLDFATSVVMNTHVKNAQRSNVERVKADRAKREAKARGDDPEKAAEASLDQATINSLMENPEQLSSFKGLLDQVLVNFVVAPQMHLPPEKRDDKVDGRYYTDSVPFNDKMAVFNKLMEGVRATEQFREGSKEAVGDVAPQPSVRKPTQRAARAPHKRATS